ncbi:hypothetical protein EMCRGX_G003564 [Ephydatia muelleri]
MSRPPLPLVARQHHQMQQQGPRPMDHQMHQQGPSLWITRCMHQQGPRPMAYGSPDASPGSRGPQAYGSPDASPGAQAYGSPDASAGAQAFGSPDALAGIQAYGSPDALAGIQLWSQMLWAYGSPDTSPEAQVSPSGLPAVQVPGSVGTTWYGPGTLMNNVACTASHRHTSTGLHQTSWCLPPAMNTIPYSLPKYKVIVICS